MEHGGSNPNSETDNYILERPYDEGGVDTNIAGPSGTTDTIHSKDGTSESKESLLIELDINQSIETTKFKNNNDDAETLEFENKNSIETIIQDKESEKNQYICKLCSQVFDKHQALGGHMNGHSKDERNKKKFGKIREWFREAYPPLLNTTLASEAKLQGTPSNGVAYNNYNHISEVGNVHRQLGGQLTNQQSAQQTLLPQELQIHQQRQLQYYQGQEPQHCQYLQGLQSYQAPQSTQRNQALQSPQNYQTSQGFQNSQAPQGPQNYQPSQGSQSYQTPQGLQNFQPSQGSQSYQYPQQFQNYQIPQEPQYYQASQGSQYYQVPQGSQLYQTPQRFQNDQTPQGPQSYQTPQRPQSYQTPKGSQSYQAPQESQTYEASQKSQSNQTLQGNQTPQGLGQQFVVDAKNQQNINLNSNKTTSLAKVPSNEQKSNLSNSRDLHFQEEAQGPQRYMPNPYNLRHGDRLTKGPFINEEMNKKYYGPNMRRRRNQMISTPYSHDIVGQYRPASLPNTSDPFNQCKEE